MKFVLMVSLVLYGIYWVSTDGYAWWQQKKIKDAVKKFHKKKGYYPQSLHRLKETKYENENGETQVIMNELPIPRSGYCWEYNPSETPPKIKLVPKDVNRQVRVCPE
ncbi:MAG: hypothetical protein ABEJ65_03750 [bacterium]